MTEVVDFIEHLSDKPWSMYKASDYSIEQWHASCLIHQHDGAPTSKSECKLPIKTPNGAVNKNGVYAAAAALGGARGGVNASPEQKSSAAKVLIRHYREMDKEPPPALLKHSDFNDFLSHVGKKGMKWGVRRGPKTPIKTSSEHKKVAELRKKTTSQLTNKQIKTANERMNLEVNFRRLNPDAKARGKMKVKALLGVGAMGLLTIKRINSKEGQASIAMAKKFLASSKVRSATRKAAKTAAKNKQLILPFGQKVINVAAKTGPVQGTLF